MVFLIYQIIYKDKIIRLVLQLVTKLISQIYLIRVKKEVKKEEGQLFQKDQIQLKILTEKNKLYLKFKVQKTKMMKILILMVIKLKMGKNIK